MTSQTLGKMPPSVWSIATEPFIAPAHLGTDHYAAFPSELPRRIISGWSPRGVCCECGEGRRPVSEKSEPYNPHQNRFTEIGAYIASDPRARHGKSATTLGYQRDVAITGYACSCPEPTAPTAPAVVLDPFMGTGTTIHVAHALGRQGIGTDLSDDYCRIARDPDVRGQRVAKVRGFKRERRVETEGQADLFGEGVA